MDLNIDPLTAIAIVVVWGLVRIALAYYKSGNQVSGSPTLNRVGATTRDMDTNTHSFNKQPKEK